MEQSQVLVSVLYNLEAYMNETIKPLCEKQKTLKAHHFLVFSEEMCSNFIFQQEPYAPIMMHAVAQRMAHSMETVKAIGIVAQGGETSEQKGQIIKTILYFPVASYTRTYTTDPEFNELGEKWYRPEEEVFGFMNPFFQLNQQIIDHIPQLDLRLTYGCICKKFRQQRRRYIKQHRPASEVYYETESSSAGSDSDEVP